MMMMMMMMIMTIVITVIIIADDDVSVPFPVVVFLGRFLGLLFYQALVG